MKVVCISNDLFSLTIGKIYDVDSMDGYYSLIDDTGIIRHVFTSRFISLEKYRNNQINLILQDESSLYR